MCRLDRLIYGLNQSSKQWYLRFHCAMTWYDFTMIDVDHCVYIKQHKDKYVLLSLYMDDILIVGNDLEFVQTIKRWLSSTFEMNDVWKTSYIFGIKDS